MKRLTIEAICNSEITYNQIEKIIKMLKKEFKGNVAITKHDDIHIVMNVEH